MSFSFGTTPASTSSAKPSGFTFGTAPASIAAPGGSAFGFGTPVAATTSAPSVGGFGFGSGGAFGTSSTANTGFKSTSSFGGFGTGTTSTTAAGTGGGLPFGAMKQCRGAVPAAATFAVTTGVALKQPFSLGTGLGGAPGNAFGTAPQSRLGLGGTTNSTSSGANEANKSDIKALKETQIPNEILTTVDDFKKLVKEERSISSDIAHISSRIHDKIKVETEALSRLVSILSSGIKKNKAALDKLKLEAAQELRNAEIAQRTKDTPGALQYENVAPYEYFSRLVANFENDMLKYRQQIDETEQHLQASASSAALSPEDLSKAIRKIHEAFTSLAGRYQHIHDCIQEQKGLFVKLHRQIYGVSTDLFDSSRPAPLRSNVAALNLTMEGPSPFILGHRDPFTAVRANLTAQPGQAPAANPGPSQSGPPTMSLGGNPSSFGGTAANTTFGQQPQQGMFSSGFNSLNQSQGLLGASTMSPFSKVDNTKKICFC